MPSPPETASSPDLVTRLVRNILPSVALLAIFAVVVRASVLRLSNDDTFFHLRFGSEFRHGWAPWRPGSVTQFATREWVPTQWAAQVAMSWAEGLGGLVAVAWVAGACLLTFVLVVYLACRRRAAPLVSGVVTGMALLGAAPGLSARPQVISYILVTVTVSAWLATADDGRLRWWLVPVTWAWATMHGMWPVGIVIGVVAVLGIALDQRDPRRLKALLVPGASLLACALTPVGPVLIKEIFVVGSRGKYFAEWGPPSFTDPSPMVASLLLALVLLVWFRTGDVSWTHGLLFLLAGAWCLYSMRTVPVGVALIAPVAAATLSRLVPSHPLDRRERLLAWGGWAVGLAAVALIAPHTLRVGPDLPAWTSRELSALPADAVVLNEWDWGGYLMWQHPELDFVISGYGDIYTDAELERNIDIVRLSPEWDQKVRDLDPNIALLSSDSSLAYALVNAESWEVIREDGGVSLLAPPGSG